MVSWEVAHGVEVNKAGEVEELARKILRLGGEGRELGMETGGGFHWEFGPVDRERVTV